MPTEFPDRAKLVDPELNAEVVRRTMERAVAAVCPRWLCDRREDIVQVAMMKALAATRKKGEQDRRVAGSYLWKVAYSATADEIRRHRARQAEVAMEAQALERSSPAGSHDPASDQEAREFGEAIRDCMGRSAPDRRVAVQFHLLGHGLAEIESLTDWNAKKVRNLVYRGLAELRKCLGGKGYTP